MSSHWDDEYPPYVPVARRRALNKALAAKLKREGRQASPVEVTGGGRNLARTFWGQAWCRHLASFSDFENRLPRGRSYLRHGAVVDLQIEEGKVTALVNGTRLYTVEIRIQTLAAATWSRIRTACQGQIGSLLELLQGRLSHEVMAVVTDRRQGLLPLPGEISLGCSCPDWATMCKHVAAVLFGVGVRLDDEPELLFRLRGVEPLDLVAGDLALPGARSHDETVLEEADLAAIFGIDLETAPGNDPAPPTAPTAPTTAAPATPAAATPAPLSGPFSPTGPAIAALRGYFGLTSEEFADVLDASVASVYRWEKAPGAVRVQGKYRDKLRHLADIRTEILEGRFQGVPGSGPGRRRPTALS